MKCPFCIDKNKETSVLDSRPSENGSVIRRRRVCIDCKGRFTTHERIQFREIVVVKKDGDKVNFDILGSHTDDYPVFPAIDNGFSFSINESRFDIILFCIFH